MKVIENYIWFPSVHENKLILKFEMHAPQLFWRVYKIFLNSEYAISKQTAVKIDPGWASVKTDPTFYTE